MKYFSLKFTTKYRWSSFFAFILAIGLVLPGCDSLTGPAGEDGPPGPQGEIGPAGEDGSMMYANEGAPSSDIGTIGDFYLDTSTGELYGPKDADGWGNPIIVLMGEDGADGRDGEDGEDGADGRDGEDGQDGQDGEDGSQIYSGEGEPDEDLGQTGDYYLDTVNYDLYGPKTSSGWGVPLNLKGASGNANVTRYLFPAHDFSETNEFTGIISLDGDDVNDSVWLAYMVDENGWKHKVPGYGRFGNSQYGFYHSTSNGIMAINLRDGPGEEYDPIEIVRIEISETIPMKKVDGEEILIPNDLDLSDYDAVADHFGF